jgi:hypothetical protein
MPAVATTTAATPASAALPIYMPAAAQLYNWTGFYVGGNLGFGCNAGSFVDPLGNTLTPTNSSLFLGGGQLGLNYQFWGSVLSASRQVSTGSLNANNTGSAVLLANPPWRPHGQHRFGYGQQSVANYGNWPPRVRMGSRAPLRQGRRRVGRVKYPAIRIDGGPFPVSTSNSNVGWIAASESSGRFGKIGWHGSNTILLDSIAQPCRFQPRLEASLAAINSAAPTVAFGW